MDFEGGSTNKKSRKANDTSLNKFRDYWENMFADTCKRKTTAPIYLSGITDRDVVNMSKVKLCTREMLQPLVEVADDIAKNNLHFNKDYFAMDSSSEFERDYNTLMSQGLHFIEASVREVMEKRDRDVYLQKREKIFAKFDLESRDPVELLPRIAEDTEIRPIDDRLRRKAKDNQKWTMALRYACGWSYAKIAKYVGMTQWSVQKLIKLHESETGLDGQIHDCEEDESKHVKIDEIETRRRFLFKQLEMHRGDVTLRSLGNMHQLAFGAQKAVSISTVQRELKALRVTRKKPVYIPAARNSEINKKRRYVYLAKLFYALQQGRKVISIDETGYCGQMPKEKLYCPVGDHWPIIPKTKRLPNMTIIIASSQSAVEQVQFVEGGCNSALYSLFFGHLILNVKEFSNQDPLKRPLILMDNVAFHRNKLLIHLAKKMNIDVLFTPTFSPMMNPVEYINCELKRLVRKHRQQYR